jgi:ABC-2 type transport system ATP-binding protein
MEALMYHSAAAATALQGSDAAVVTTGLQVTRGKNPVLRGLDFSIPTGRITGLLGPSGSGKTTLMRAIVGVQRVSSGSIQVLGLPAGHPTLRHRVGYVTQSPSVYPDLTVEANVRYFGAMHRKGRAEAAEAIAAVGLERQARQRTADLSGGQLSRVSLACALVAHPRLLVLDEPTVGLDPVLRADLWDRFRSMAESGTTLLVSSHVMEEASHCGSLLLLREGRLLAQLTPQELSRRGHSADLERAFLHIIQNTDEMPDGGAASAGTAPPEPPGPVPESHSTPESRSTPERTVRS